MELLRPIRPNEASADYLYTRIRSRRSRLIAGSFDERSVSVRSRQSLRNEYHWVYIRLNRRLRNQLQPLFEYEELRTLILALRYLAAGDRSALLEVLNGSLLNRSLCRVLTGAPRVAVAVAALERLLADDNPFCRGLTEAYLKQGPGGVEQAMNGGYLHQVIGSTGPQVVMTYFRYLIDLRNLLALFKHLHWQLPLPPPLIEGGEIGLARLGRAWSGQNLNGVSELTRKLTGLDVDPFKAGIEETLCRGLEVRLRRAGRDPLQVGVLIDHLWRCRMTARHNGLEAGRSQAGEARQELEFML
ncbi:MAG TPA: hypothetical protein VJ974_05900 [Geopsychrobacteraceae bacterium]|nr:hypothetical protein [Geopsychrobacteraceae bacterium]